MLGNKLAKGGGIKVVRLPAELLSTGSSSPIYNYDFWEGLLLSREMEVDQGIHNILG